jgi:hypothetical protein
MWRTELTGVQVNGTPAFCRCEWQPDPTLSDKPCSPDDNGNAPVAGTCLDSDLVFIDGLFACSDGDPIPGTSPPVVIPFGVWYVVGQFTGFIGGCPIFIDVWYYDPSPRKCPGGSYPWQVMVVNEVTEPCWECELIPGTINVTKV